MTNSSAKRLFPLLLTIGLVASYIFMGVCLILGYYLHAPAWWERYVEWPVLVALSTYLLVHYTAEVFRVVRER